MTDDNVDLGLVARTLFPDERHTGGPSEAFDLADEIRGALEGERPYPDRAFLVDLQRLAQLLGVTKRYIESVTEGDDDADNHEEA